MLLTHIAAYFNKMFDRQATYGSELEQYIVSRRPQSVEEIDHWTKQFNQRHAQRGWL